MGNTDILLRLFNKQSFSAKGSENRRDRVSQYQETGESDLS